MKEASRGTNRDSRRGEGQHLEGSKWEGEGRPLETGQRTGGRMTPEWSGVVWVRKVEGKRSRVIGLERWLGFINNMGTRRRTGRVGKEY